MIVKDIKKGELYIEAIIYVVGLLYGIYLYSAGGYFLNLIPIVFIIGLLGKVIFDRPLMTTILGIVFNTFIVYKLFGLTGKLNFLSGLYVAIMLLAGEIVGQIYFAMYERKKKSKRAKKIKIKEEKIDKNTKFSLPFSAASVIFAVILMHSYVNGNLVEYYQKKAVLQKYINERYQENSKNFKIETPSINLTKDSRDYEFKVKDLANSSTCKMILKSNGYIEDEYSITEDRMKVIAQKEKIDTLLKQTVFNTNNYEDITVIPSSNRILIVKKVNENTEAEKEKYSKQAYAIIEILKVNNLLNDTLMIEVRMNNKEENEIFSSASIIKSNIESEDFNNQYIMDALTEEIIEID